MKILIISFLMFFASSVYSQVVNAYAKVNSITSNTIFVSDINEVNDTFENGEFVIIMQMQDDVIGSNTSNTLGFGDLSSIESAGLYDIVKIVSHTESSGAPTSFTFSRSLKFTPNINTNSSVQIISFPTLGTPDYTSISPMSAVAWDGNVGGVLAFNVDGIFTIAHDINVDAQGFRGGETDIASTGSGSLCEDAVFISTRTTRAFKGEGIYKNTNTAYEAARGKILNGGGGGNSHNGGGAGGGNYTAGGSGGVGYGCRNVSPRSAGGIGGISLSPHISNSRVFLGGGAGAGERNNNYVTNGGNGGGIIFIKADGIRTNGSCSGMRVSADGENAIDIVNDGAGGGGAGGSIVIQVNSWNIVATCPVTIAANGGRGGSANTGTTHGGGGGGGQGVVIYSISEPTVNTTTTTNNGAGGCSNTSSPCNSVAGKGSGTNGDGVIDGTTTPLPVLLELFNVSLINSNLVELNWVTSTELNNAYFIIERSVDGFDWEEVSRTLAEGNSVINIEYTTYDKSPLFGLSYYRLKQVDFDGETTVFPIERIFNESEINIRIYPNPAKEFLNVVFEEENIGELKLFNAHGQLVEFLSEFEGSEVKLDIASLPKGIYLLSVVNGLERITKKVIVE